MQQLGVGRGTGFRGREVAVEVVFISFLTEAKPKSTVHRSVPQVLKLKLTITNELIKRWRTLYDFFSLIS